MKVPYEFVTGKVEVEVPEEWGLLHKEMDRLEENNNHTETRRHDSMDMLADEHGVQFADAVDVGECVVSHLDNEALGRALCVLSSEQRKLIQEVYFDYQSQATIAQRDGVSRMAINNRLNRIYSVLKKNLR